MAVIGKLYGNLFETVFRGEIDWDDDTIKVALTSAAYSVDQDAHDYFDDITNERIGDTGYTAGGETLASKTSTYTAGTNTFALDAANTLWTTSTITARIAVVYDASPASDATRPLICYQDAGVDIATTAGTFTIQWHSDGIVKIVVT